LDLSRFDFIVTGGAGFLGKPLVKKLSDIGCRSIWIPRSKRFDLTQSSHAKEMFQTICRDPRHTIVIHLAAEVGGIGANMKRPGRFFFANIAMGLNLIEESRKRGIYKFIQVGTVCAYPKFTPVPFNEDDIWNGYPEETNAPYGVAKKSLFVMLDAYNREYGMRSAIPVPVNLYGPEDNFNLETSHVIPALIRKFLEAKENRKPQVECWGTGSASREFLYVGDAADGIIEITKKVDNPTPINLGTGSEITIRDLSNKIADLCGYEGEIVWDSSKPDGQPRRCLDISKAKAYLGWEPKVGLDEGLKRTIDWYVKNRCG